MDGRKERTETNQEWEGRDDARLRYTCSTSCLVCIPDTGIADNL